MTNGMTSVVMSVTMTNGFASAWQLVVKSLSVTSILPISL